MMTKRKPDSRYSEGDLVALRCATFRTRGDTPGICVRVFDGPAAKTVEVLFSSGTLETFSLPEADWYLDRLGAGGYPADSRLGADRTVLMLAYLEGKFDRQFEAASRLHAESTALAEELETVLAASG